MTLSPTDVRQRADAVVASGVGHRTQGRAGEALAAFDQALSVLPDHPDALFNRGAVLLELGRTQDALSAFDRLLAVADRNADGWLGRGVALQALLRHAEALAAFDRALALNPASDQIPLLMGRGEALLGLRRAGEAVPCFDRALALAPGHIRALNSRGMALFQLQRHDDALACFDAMLKVESHHPVAVANRGTMLIALKRHAEAALAFKRLAELAPDHPDAGGNLFLARLNDCDWTDYAALKNTIEAAVAAGRQGMTPFWFLVVSENEDLQRKCAATYVRKVAPPAARKAWHGRPYRHDKIRLGYLGADFRNHPMSHMIGGLFKAHDRARFEVTGLAYGPPTDHAMRDHIRAACDRFIDVEADSDRGIAERIAGLEIDILIDLSTLTQFGRPGIAAQRAAPVQINYMGHPGTSGLPDHDYILADRHVIPAAQEQFYVEKIALMPETYWVEDSLRALPVRPLTRAEVGLPDQGFVFCCFNVVLKIAPPVFDIWMRLLGAVDGSVLWLLADSPALMANLRREAEARGIAGRRLIFAPKSARDHHFGRHLLADLFLDTRPYGAHTTAADALWTGLPVVTCAGQSFAARVAVSLLHAIGTPELITTTPETYEARALDLARDPGRLAALRAKIIRHRDTAPLFNTDRFRRHVEAAYQTMWQRAEAGLAPITFQVPVVDGA